MRQASGIVQAGVQTPPYGPWRRASGRDTHPRTRGLEGVTQRATSHNSSPCALRGYGITRSGALRSEVFVPIEDLDELTVGMLSTGPGPRLRVSIRRLVWHSFWQQANLAFYKTKK